ncbi:flagellar hook-length control protein FliK [Ponticaulis koreensis]|uniref:flagellar hook-length control protein FliK n=1 Tax=Ponticaulis koreensis TaxID=1123045 RepID=UPI0003B714D5|nr:flagellar hook-length control protein FliK [Ponticaulis koreensis]
MNIVPFGLSVAKTVTDDPSRAFDGDAGEFAMLLEQGNNSQKAVGTSYTDSFVSPEVQALFAASAAQALPSQSSGPLTGVAPPQPSELVINADGSKIRTDTALSNPIYKDSIFAGGWARPHIDGQAANQLAGDAGNSADATAPAKAGGSALDALTQNGNGARPAIATGRVPVEIAGQGQAAGQTLKSAAPASMSIPLNGLTSQGAETALKQALPESNSFAAAASSASQGGEGKVTSGTAQTGGAATSSAGVQDGASSQNGSSTSSGQGNGQQGQSGPQTQAATQAVSSSKELAASELLPEDFVQEMDLAEADAGDVQMTEAQRSAARADAALPAHLRGAAATQAAVLAQVSQKMLQKFDGKTSRFEIRLDPAELGKVDVRIEVDRDGRVQAVLAAKEAVAADALTRGLRSLENALTQAGFDLGDKGVQVELDQNNSKKSFTHSGDSSDQTELQQAASDTEQQPAEARTVTPQIQAWSRQRLDVKA